MDYSNITVIDGVSEIQKITLNSSFNVPYILSFENVETGILIFSWWALINHRKKINF